METHAVRAYNGRYGDFDISTLFWGALVAVAVFGFCLFASKAINWLRNRRKPDGVAVDAGVRGDPSLRLPDWLRLSRRWAGGR